jgi:hypothetical protein
VLFFGRTDVDLHSNYTHLRVVPTTLTASASANMSANERNGLADQPREIARVRPGASH